MDLSIVVPVYNEVENVPLLYPAVTAALKDVTLSWELILVDDGSRDNSLVELEKLAAADPRRVRVVALRRNFGQTAAIAAGIDHSGGEIIVLMDADLQNDPADIPMMLAKLNEGYDVVSGWRFKRQDNLVRRLPSQMANGLISWATGVSLHDYGCTLKAYRREVLTGFRLYGEMHRFIPVYANTVGAKIVEMKVNHHPRRFGKAKYGLERTLKVLLDLFTVKFLTAFASKPIYMFGGVGFAMFFVAILLWIYLFIRRVIFLDPIGNSPILIGAAVILIMGFQSILMGLLAELQVRTYHESQGKPTYTVRKTINVETPHG
jgi:glycosyltransferase involved in cell wall biosynthesis